MTDLEEVPEPTHTCCFHIDTQVMLASYPPRMQYQEVCCFCNAKRRYEPPQPSPPTGHGPYHPLVSPYKYPYRTYTTGTFGGTHNGTRNCPCRPENGGSGICGCILGGPVVTG